MRRWLLVGLTLVGMTSLPAVGAAASDHLFEVTTETAVARDASVPHDQDFVLARLAPAAVRRPGERPVMGRWVKVPILAGESPLDALARVSARPEVELAELNTQLFIEPFEATRVATTTQRTTANDPLRDYQWHLDRAEVEPAWSSGRGAGIVVAVVDTGVRAGGEDLACHTFVSEFNAIIELRLPQEKTNPAQEEKC